MANTTGEASAISVPVLVQQEQVSDSTRTSHSRSLAKPTGPATEKELVKAIEETQEHDNAFDVRDSQRWSALDQLLRVSFGLISPAYLFNSFPPIR